MTNPAQRELYPPVEPFETGRLERDPPHDIYWEQSGRPDGQPVVFLGDLSHLRIETTDLNEADIWAIAVGQDVTLTFDGLPGKALSGQVSRIAPMASIEQGGTNYTVVVELDEQDPGLRWGMTAYVDITVK